MLRNKGSKEIEQIIKNITSILESENEKQWSSLFKHYFHQIKNLKYEEFKIVMRKNFRGKRQNHCRSPAANGKERQIYFWLSEI